MSLQPQQALEQAVVNALQAATTDTPPGLGWLPQFCHRMYDGQPPPSCGQWFASVWSANKRDALPMPSPGLAEGFTVNVTVTVRFVKPFDQWVFHRDFLEQQVNTIIDFIHLDSANYFVARAANLLAGFRTSSRGDLSAAPGFYLGLKFGGASDIQDVGVDWFNARVEDAEKNVGIAQRVLFVGAARARATLTLR